MDDRETKKNNHQLNPFRMSSKIQIKMREKYSHLTRVETSDVPTHSAAFPELVKELFPVLIKITFTLGEVFVYQRIRTVLVTDIQDGFLLLCLLLLLLLDAIVLDLSHQPILALAQEAQALGPSLGLPELG